MNPNFYLLSEYRKNTERYKELQSKQLNIIRAVVVYILKYLSFIVGEMSIVFTKRSWIIRTY